MKRTIPLPKHKPPPRPKSAAVWFQNYKQVMTDEFVSGLPPDLKEGHRRFLNATYFLYNLGIYYGVPRVRRECDNYLKKLNAYLKKNKIMYKKKKGAKKPNKKAATRRDESDEEDSPRRSKRSKGKKNYAFVDTIDEAVKLLRRFKNLYAREKVPTTRLLGFIKALQRAIHERRIRKGDRYASEIDVAQRTAINAYHNAKGVNVTVKVPTAFRERVNEIARSEKIRPSVSFLKRFVGFVGKSYHEVGARLKKLAENLGFMYERGMIRQTDPYFGKVKEAERALNKAISNRSHIVVPSATLSGLNGIISEEEEAVEGLAGFDYEEDEDGYDDTEDEDQEPEVQTAKELSQKHFDTFPFTGYHKKLLNEPERGFWMCIYGLPWQGKTTYCVGLAKYLAENFGNVLYISSESYSTQALKEVVNKVQGNEMNQIHFTPSLRKAPPLDVYDFIFIDSANAAGLTVEDVMKLREKNPGKSFIVVLQSVKSGDFHGKQGWRHYPNIVVKIHAYCAHVEKNHYSDKPVMLPLPKLPGGTETKENSAA